MHFNKLSRGELVAMIGGVLLGIGVFLDWFSTKGKGEIAGKMGSFSAWDVFPIARIILLLAAIAPIVLAYIIIRDHSLSWPRGEMTAVIAVIAFGLVFYNGLVARPGTSTTLVSLKLGWLVALVGALLMLAGSAFRASTTERKRKPPGTI